MSSLGPNSATEPSAKGTNTVPDVPFTTTPASAGTCLLSMGDKVAVLSATLETVNTASTPSTAVKSKALAEHAVAYPLALITTGTYQYLFQSHFHQQTLILLEY